MIKKLLNSWTKKSIKENLTPVCLVCVDNAGNPHVLTEHESKTLEAVFKHLSESVVISESKEINQ